MWPNVPEKTRRVGLLLEYNFSRPFLTPIRPALLFLSPKHCRSQRTKPCCNNASSNIQPIRLNPHQSTRFGAQLYSLDRQRVRKSISHRPRHRFAYMGASIVASPPDGAFSLGYSKVGCPTPGHAGHCRGNRTGVDVAHRQRSRYWNNCRFIRLSTFHSRVFPERNDKCWRPRVSCRLFDSHIRSHKYTSRDRNARLRFSISRRESPVYSSRVSNSPSTS